MTDKPRRPTKRAQQLRNDPTDHERLLWLELRKRRFDGHKFSRQIPVGPFICDFVCRRRKLVIELDGGQHSANMQEDESRTRFLEKAGYRVIRFWNHDVSENLEGVLQKIGEALVLCPPPDPLPDGEGGF
jgi:very-short-patch-repair endonuclease